MVCSEDASASCPTEALTFFERMRVWSQEFPPAEDDRDALATYEAIGLTGPTPIAQLPEAVRDALEARFGPPDSAKLDWRPTTSVTLDAERSAALLKLVDALDDNDDVQNVYANFDIPDAVMQNLPA